MPPALTPEMDAWTQWSQEQTPETAAGVLDALEPTITKATKAYAGQVNPLVLGSARRMALSALGTYDPRKGSLTTHVYGSLQGLRRTTGQLTSAIKIPERVTLDHLAINRVHNELFDKLGRPPTDDELADHTGISQKRINHVRGFSPAMTEGYFATLGEGGHTPAVVGRHTDTWAQLIRDELSPIDQHVLDWTLGLNGKPQLSNQEIARKLNRSPGLISQRKGYIQSLLEKETALSPFGS